MDIYTGSYKGLACYCLENEMIKLTVLPELGSKIASLIYKPQNFEVFFQPTEGFYSLAGYGADFSQFDTSGADEMFPTIDCCIYPYPGYCGEKLPDHGELWSQPWVVTEADGRLTTQAKGKALSYLFSRSIEIHGSTVCMEYTIYNTGYQPLYGLWAFHGLTASDALTKILLPTVKKVMTVQNSSKLGPAKTTHDFPITTIQGGDKYHLDTIAATSAGKTEKIYVEGKMTQGQAALTLNKGQLLYKLLFPVQHVPYLGIWMNEGGYKGEYNCALEPSTGYYDSLEVTKEQESLEPIPPGKIIKWHLHIELIPSPAADYDDLIDKL